MFWKLNYKEANTLSSLANTPYINTPDKNLFLLRVEVLHCITFFEYSATVIGAREGSLSQWKKISAHH